MLYSSIENKKIKELKKLNEKKYRDEFNKYLIEGENLILEAHKKGVLECVYILDGFDFDINVEKNYVTLNVMKYISNLDNPNKYIGVCSKENNDLIGNRVVILDSVQDPGNIGTIIRSCVAFDVDTVILSKDSCDVYNSKVLRATQGMIYNINVLYDDIEKTIDALKLKDYKVYGTKLKDATLLNNITKSDKFALVMGNEGNGVSKSALDKCTDYIYINMNEKCESLNVGVATSIILYELGK